MSRKPPRVEEPRGAVDPDFLPAGMQLRNQVRFNDGEGPALGVVTRVWDNGYYITIRSDGRAFVRDARAATVHFCDHRGHECENLAGWPPDYVCRDCSDWDNDVYVRWFIYDEIPLPAEGLL